MNAGGLHDRDAVGTARARFQKRANLRRGGEARREGNGTRESLNCWRKLLNRLKALACHLDWQRRNCSSDRQAARASPKHRQACGKQPRACLRVDTKHSAKAKAQYPYRILAEGWTGVHAANEIEEGRDACVAIQFLRPGENARTNRHTRNQPSVAHLRRRTPCNADNYVIARAQKRRHQVLHTPRHFRAIHRRGCGWLPMRLQAPQC